MHQLFRNLTDTDTIIRIKELGVIRLVGFHFQSVSSLLRGEHTAKQVRQRTHAALGTEQLARVNVEHWREKARLQLVKLYATTVEIEPEIKFKGFPFARHVFHRGEIKLDPHLLGLDLLWLLFRAFNSKKIGIAG